MIIRYKGDSGQGRLILKPEDTIGKLLNNIAENDGEFNACDILINLDGVDLTALEWDTTLEDAGLRHGDIIQTTVIKSRQNKQARNETFGESSDAAPIAGTISASTNTQFPRMNALDEEIMLLPNTISVGRDPLLCTHLESGMCQNCMPIPSYDEEYHKTNKIKHLSLYSYKNQCVDKNLLLSSGEDTPFLLETPKLTIKTPCTANQHKPWPDGICTSCAPPSITLQRQTFRMVDHVEFESSNIIEKFVEYWRSTGRQRYGWLYGKYAPYSDVPLGIKAIVSAIYEPPQDDSMDGIQLHLPNNQLDEVDSFASKLGLERVGAIYTDLLDDGTNSGKVICKRDVSSFYLSSAECISSAKLQLSLPTYLNFAEGGKFSSRAVTCVVTGNSDGHIGVSCYQVSVLCEALVENDLISPCVDPCIVRLNSEIPNKFIPTISYTHTDSFGLKVTKNVVSTFPTDFLIVNSSHGFPNNANPSFSTESSFPIENRPEIKIQSITDLYFVTGASLEDIRTQLSNFHLLFFLSHSKILLEDELSYLYSLINNPNLDLSPLTTSENWKTIEILSSSTQYSSQTSGSVEPWACASCTYINTTKASACEICETRR